MTGSGVSAKTYITQASPNPTGIGVTATVNTSQLVAAGTTLTIACPDMGVISQALTGDASYFTIVGGGFEPSGYITQHFDGTLGQEWRIGNGGRDSGTSIVITRHGAINTKNITQMGIGYGDNPPAPPPPP